MTAGTPTGFSQWLKARRRALDLTRERLAACVGCSHATIEKLENGERRPSRQIADLLARCLQVPEVSLGEFVLFARGGPLPGALADIPLYRASARARAHLPAPPTEFIGRVAEVERVRGLMQEAGVRLLSVLGPPGIGKTRLALEAAGGMVSSFEDGIYFVPLSELAGAELVMPAIAGALGIRQWPHQPLLDTVVERLRNKQLLLVLDNFEHLLAAAPGVGLLLSGAPGLKALATSRTALRIYGEHTFVVPPMSLPDSEDSAAPRDPELLSRYEAISLFVRRASAANQDFALSSDNLAQVVAICRRLDGLPLAIELAANRAGVLSPGQILERLAGSLDLPAGGATDLPARQRSLRGAIAWGYDLLTERQQVLLRLLAVFAGGCSLPALEALAPGANLRGMDLVDTLAALVGSSLVQRHDTEGAVRFIMLDTIHEFAREKLVESGETKKIMRAHAGHYLQLAEEAEPELQGGDQAAWLSRLEAEHDNIRAAYSYFSDEGDGVSLARIASALRRFWYLRGHFSEGHAWLRQALDYEDRLPHDLLARVLHSLGLLDWSMGDLCSAEHQFSESLQIWRELGDSRGIANMLNNLGIALLPQGKYGEARMRHSESLEIYRELGDKWSIALSLANLGLVALDSGDYARAEALLCESLELRRELGDEQGVAQALNNRGIVARCVGDIEASRTLHNESLDIFRRIGDRWSIALALANLGYAELGGDLSRAAGHFVACLPMFRDLGARSGIAGCFEGLAQIASREGRSELAASLFGVAEKVRSDLDSPMPPYNRAAYEVERDGVVAALGEQAFGIAWQQGNGLDVEAACLLAADAWPMHA